MIEQALQLTKARLGISSNVRDTYLKAIIQGVEDDLVNRVGIKIDQEDAGLLMFIVDMATYRYENKDKDTIPRHLQLRLHNLMISKKRDQNV